MDPKCAKCELLNVWLEMKLGQLSLLPGMSKVLFCLLAIFFLLIIVIVIDLQKFLNLVSNWVVCVFLESVGQMKQHLLFLYYTQVVIMLDLLMYLSFDKN